jgi:phosphatidylglycerophosphate synthase
VLVAAIVTDLLDGPIARRTGTATAFGGLFDHASDCLFVVSGQVGGAVRGVFPWILPALVVTAFVQYVVDSYWLHRRRQLRGSWLGRYNGILYFVPPCGDTLVRLGLDFLRPAVTLVCWLLVVSTCVSIGQRLLSVKQSGQTAPASPAAGTASRTPR